MKRSRLLLLFALPLVLVPALELGLRAAAKLTRRERGLSFDADLGWRMVPGAEKQGRLWGGARPTRINSHGWRDAEVELEAAGGAGRLRMVAVGDSFTFGVGVDLEDRYTEQLETLCAGLEVLNLGMNAVGTDQELLYLEHDGLSYAPALVLCALFEGNDFQDVSYSRHAYWPKPYFRLEHGELVQFPPCLTWDVRLRCTTYVGEACYRVLQPFMAHAEQVPGWHERDALPLVGALLLRMRASSERAGARFLVLLIRSRSGPHGADALLPALKRARIPVVDTLQRFSLAADPEQLYLPDEHWSPAGHRAAAELIAARLRDLGWL